MTIAVIVTVGVSLTLFGVGLLTDAQVKKVRGNWYDKIEVSVFLCTDFTKGGNCEPDQGVTDAQRDNIRKTLEANPEVAEVMYESKAEAYEQFKKIYADSPLLASRTEEQMQDSFRIKLVNPENYQGVVSEAKGLQGVNSVQDLESLLKPLFTTVSAVQWATIALSVFLLLAAALQIGNTIRVAAFTRRREIGIMRLVGASNLYILLPFLLESLVAGVIGILIACSVLALGYYFIIAQTVQPLITALAWIGWSEVLGAMLILAAVGVTLAIVPTLIATRKYVQI
ncbi:ABC transporter permease [Tessaracoccus sp. OH4464_COT-324]|nr:ABC transporter permease [Tessaracoccus sp. OH4464_COT-324]